MDLRAVEGLVGPGRDPQSLRSKCGRDGVVNYSYLRREAYGRVIWGIMEKNMETTILECSSSTVVGVVARLMLTWRVQ